VLHINSPQTKIWILDFQSAGEELEVAAQQKRCGMRLLQAHVLKITAILLQTSATRQEAFKNSRAKNRRQTTDSDFFPRSTGNKLFCPMMGGLRPADVYSLSLIEIIQIQQTRVKSGIAAVSRTFPVRTAGEDWRFQD